MRRFMLTLIGSLALLLTIGFGVSAASNGKGVGPLLRSDTRGQTGGTAQDPGSPNRHTDHALFDNEIGSAPPDKTVLCKGDHGFVVHLAVRAINGPATVRVLFEDGDFIDFPLQNDQVYSWSEAAGDTSTVDRIITVKPANTTSHFVAWMSAQAIEGHVSCTTTH